MATLLTRGEILDIIEEEIKKCEDRLSDPSVKGTEWTATYTAGITLQRILGLIHAKEQGKT